MATFVAFIGALMAKQHHFPDDSLKSISNLPRVNAQHLHISNLENKVKILFLFIL